MVKIDIDTRYYSRLERKKIAIRVSRQSPAMMADGGRSEVVYHGIALTTSMVPIYYSSVSFPFIIYFERLF